MQNYRHKVLEIGALSVQQVESHLEELKRVLWLILFEKEALALVN